MWHIAGAFSVLLLIFARSSAKHPCEHSANSSYIECSSYYGCYQKLTFMRDRSIEHKKGCYDSASLNEIKEGTRVWIRQTQSTFTLEKSSITCQLNRRIDTAAVPNAVLELTCLCEGDSTSPYNETKPCNSLKIMPTLQHAMPEFGLTAGNNGVPQQFHCHRSENRYVSQTLVECSLNHLQACHVMTPLATGHGYSGCGCNVNYLLRGRNDRGFKWSIFEALKVESEEEKIPREISEKYFCNPAGYCCCVGDECNKLQVQIDQFQYCNPVTHEMCDIDQLESTTGYCSSYLSPNPIVYGLYNASWNEHSYKYSCGCDTSLLEVHRYAQGQVPYPLCNSANTYCCCKIEADGRTCVPERVFIDKAASVSHGAANRMRGKFKSAIGWREVMIPGENATATLNVTVDEGNSTTTAGNSSESLVIVMNATDLP